MFLLLCCRGICWMQGWWPWQSFHPLTFCCFWGWWLRSLLLLLILTWWWSVWWLTFSWRQHAQSAWLSLSLFKEALCAKPDNNMNHVVKKVLLFLLGCCRKRIILFSTILASNHWGQYLFSMQGTLRVLLTTNHRSQASLVSWWVLSQLKMILGWGQRSDEVRICGDANGQFQSFSLHKHLLVPEAPCVLYNQMVKTLCCFQSHKQVRLMPSLALSRRQNP